MVQFSESHRYTDEDDAALAAALARSEQGHTGKPAAAFFTELRARHNLPPFTENDSAE